MITLICGTIRPNNETQKFVQVYINLLKKRGVDCETIYLENLPKDFASANDILGKASTELKIIIDQKLLPASKLVVFAPEYNGSFPGALKSFIDCIEPKFYTTKTIALVGISAGRSGNLRGLSHLTGIFHYLGADVIPTKVDIARIHSLRDDNGTLTDEHTLKMLDAQIDRLLK